MESSRALPTGVVTFLLTDIEGSTRLWEADHTAMAEALVRHDAIVGACVRRLKGHVVKSKGEGDSVFADLGATRILECWGDDVPDGKVTDFRRAVQATEDEAVVFSWVEWPDKATREAAMGKMDDLMKTDPRMSPEKNPMPFDGKRMIYGGFSPVVTLEK